MTALSRLLTLGLVVLTVGCGSPRAAPPDETPLSVDQWKTLPVQQKYEIETLERLKHADPKLQEPPAWDKFTREVLLPAKKKEMPTGRPKS